MIYIYLYIFIFFTPVYTLYLNNICTYSSIVVKTACKNIFPISNPYMMVLYEWLQLNLYINCNMCSKYYL